MAYYFVREAIQSWDDEFGYELVEEDWDLKYNPPNPQLAAKEYQAAELARMRLRALAAAAPQAYGAYRAGGGFGSADQLGNGDDDDYVDEPFGDGAEGPAEPVGDARFASAPVDRPVESATIDPAARAGTGPSSTPNDGVGGGASSDRYATGNSTVADTSSGTATTTPNGHPLAASAQPPSPGAPSDAAGAQSSSQDVERKPNGTPANGAYVGGDDPEQQLDKLARAAAAGDDDDAATEHKRMKVRGKNWAIADGRPGMIPIRRTIQIVVRDDALAILPEASSTNEASAAGREFLFANAPEAAYDGLLSAVENRIKGWGIAGQGLYWRPVVELKIGASGQRRVDDLTRLLKYSGVEIRAGEIAQHDEGGIGHANR